MPAVYTCVQCAQRKLSCDGQQPRCGFCYASNMTCEMPQRGSRGPKKGYLKALRSRLDHLEGMLERRTRSQQQDRSTERSNPLEKGHPPSLQPSLALQSPTPYHSLSQESAINAAGQGGLSQIALPMESWADLVQFAEPPVPSTVPIDFGKAVNLSTDVQDELNQLYFDRVRPSIPLIHQRRFMSWARSATKTSSCQCLQYAMWTLSTLFSAQFRDLTEVLYCKTKEMLDSLLARFDKDSSGDTQLVQASVLVAICESIRTHHQQAWMSAGRSFRLVQGMRFHEIDKPHTDTSISTPLDTTDAEERRRTFWMAYLLDHLFSMRNDWPITLNEHVICTRMPAPEDAFQSGLNILGPFLSEAMVDSAPASPYNECLILATICGRSLLHCQQHKISQAYGGLTADWATQTQWLDKTLKLRLEAFKKAYGPLTIENDGPLPDFVGVLGQTTVVYICKGIMETLSSADNLATPTFETLKFQARASNAIANVISLLQPLCELHFSKIHPMMPPVLFFCAEFLYNNKDSHQSFRERLQEFILVLGKLQNVNNPEQSYLDLLPRSCISSTTEWLNGTACITGDG